MPSSFVVNLDARAGLVGDDGTVHLPAVLSGIEDPAEGAVAYFNGSLWGFGSELGKVVCAPKFRLLRPLCGGRAAFQAVGGSRWGVCDVKGTVLVEPRFDALLVGPGSFMAKEGARWGLLGAAGAWIVEPVFTVAFPHGGGLWVVQRGDRYGAIDGDGVERIPFEYACLATPDEDVTPAKGPGGWGFIDRGGGWRVPPQYAAAACVGEGMLAVARGSWSDPRALVAPDGTVLTDFVYDKLATFHEGRCAFQRGARWGWLDAAGREVIPARYFAASAFRGGRAHAGGGSIVDRDGNVVSQADCAKLAPHLSPVHHAVMRRDVAALRALAAGDASFELTDVGGLGDRPSLARQFRHLVLDGTEFSPEAVTLSIRAAEQLVSDAPPVSQSPWARWIAEGHADALRDAVARELLVLPATKAGRSTWLLRALGEVSGLDLEPVSAALVSRLPAEAESGSTLGLQALIDRTSAAGSPDHLRAMLQAAIANADVARSSFFANYLRDQRAGALVCELLSDALTAISVADVDGARAAGGSPEQGIGLVAVVAALLEHAAACDVAPDLRLAEHEAWVVAAALGIVAPFAEAPLAWLSSSPALTGWVHGHGTDRWIRAVLVRHGLLDGATPDLPTALPRDIAGALAFVDTLGLSPRDLPRRPGLDEAAIARITRRLGGVLPPELRDLVQRCGGLGDGVQVTLMDLQEGGDPDNLPIGATSSGELYLLARDGSVRRGGKVVAPTLGWFLARLGVEAWGSRNGARGTAASYLEEQLDRAGAPRG